MLKDWYGIMGMSPKVFEKMKGTFEDGIIAFEESGVVHIHMILSWFERRKVKKELKKYNVNNNNKLYLVKL